MIKLYQFPISHFCEKIRWALAYKNINYQTCNLLSGPHIKTAMSLAANSEVPILVHDETVIQCSSDILNYLDSTFPEHLLTPLDAAQKKECLEWEAFVDKEIGPNIQRYFYFTLLKHPDILIPIFSYKGPWYGKWLMKLMFPKIRKAMIRGMRISEFSANKSKEKINKAIKILNERLKTQPYLVGDCFSRADLAAASLLAPLVQPEKYGLPWPSPLPQPLQSTVDEWRDDLQWVTELYDKHR